MPPPVFVTEENGEYSYLNEEAEAIHARCKRIGIIPNVYIVYDFNPNDDGIEEREDEQNTIDA
jgi:hypothetical protein